MVTRKLLFLGADPSTWSCRLLGQVDRRTLRPLIVISVITLRELVPRQDARGNGTGAAKNGISRMALRCYSPESPAPLADADRCRDELGRIRVPVYHHAEESGHHFFPGHLAVVDRLVRIGIELVVDGIVEVSVYPKLVALGDLDRAVVAELPVEVVMWNVQHDLLSSVRILDRPGLVLPADVHVGHHVDQLGI